MKESHHLPNIEQLTFNKLTSSAANGNELVGKTTLHHALGFAACLSKKV